MLVPASAEPFEPGEGKKKKEGNRQFSTQELVIFLYIYEPRQLQSPQVGCGILRQVLHNTETATVVE